MKRVTFPPILGLCEKRNRAVVEGATTVLCSALNVRIKDFCLYNFVLIGTFNAHLSEINKTKHIFSYNPTLKI